MKKIKWLVAFLIVANLLLGVIGCKDPEIHIHTYSEAWTSDANGHWHEATCEHTTEVSGKADHTFGDWKVTQEPTEEAEGSREKSCTVCEYTVPEVIEKLEHKHKFATDWTKDETHHWYAATCEHTDEKNGFADHTFGDWTVTKEATCTEEGSKVGVCEVCKKEVTKKIDAKGHCYGEYVFNNDATKEADGTKTRECSVCGHKDTVTDEGSKIIVPEFVFVKGDTVTGAAYTNNYPGVFIEGRTVTLSDFYMGKYEVTQEEYASVMKWQKVTVNGTEYALKSNPSYCTKDSEKYTLFSDDVQEKRPVEGVTWYDAVWYCNALSEKEGLTKAYNIEVTKVFQVSGETGYHIDFAHVTLNKNANGYRLPTEAEWEYAARGGDPTKGDWNYVFSGADTAAGVSYDSTKNAGLDSVGWYCYNNITGITGDSRVTKNVSGKGTHQVGKKAPNRLGLYDMSGNVSEWCYDWSAIITTTTPADGATSGDYRVRRGGSWDSFSGGCAVSGRSNGTPFNKRNLLGFRVVRSSSN